MIRLFFRLIFSGSSVIGQNRLQDTIITLKRNKTMSMKKKQINHLNKCHKMTGIVRCFPVLILTGLIALSFVGCSNSPSEQSSKTQSSVVSAESSQGSSADSSTVSEEESSEVPLILESNSEEVSKIEFSSESPKPYASLTDYINSDSAQSIIQEIEKSDTEDLVNTQLKVEDETKLVFLRSLHSDFNPELTDEFVEGVKTSVEQQSDVFLSLVDELETGIQRRDITVVVRYEDSEGNVLYEREFNNDKYADQLSEIAESLANQSQEGS